jgi:hypothetical protein
MVSAVQPGIVQYVEREGNREAGMAVRMAHANAKRRGACGRQWHRGWWSRPGGGGVRGGVWDIQF